MTFFRGFLDSRASPSGNKKPPLSNREGKEVNKVSVRLLVIQSDNYDWNEIFAERYLDDGRPIEVIQAGWDQLLVHADSPGMMSRTPILVDIKTADDAGRTTGQTIKPDFLLVRNEVRGAAHNQDWRNALLGLMYANVPSVNSLSSIYGFLERPVVQAELRKVQNRLGRERFPVIPQSYYSSPATMMCGHAFPAVLKVGHAHAGAGKMRVANHHDWEDVQSIVLMTDGKYCTSEPFVQADYDVRIQKIGHHYRAYRRTSISGNWKTNTGCSIIDETELTPAYELWIKETSKVFGGLDICTVDVIHDETNGKEYILEVNGTSSGLLPDRAREDNGYIRDVVLERMNRILVTKK